MLPRYFATAIAILSILIAALVSTHIQDTARAYRDNKQANILPDLNNASFTPPQIIQITPAELRPGINATITGTGFSSVPAQNSVVVDGIPVKVISATTTQLNISLPPNGFPCQLTRNVTVKVTVGGQQSSKDTSLRAAWPVSLKKGEVVVPKDLESARCLELDQTGGRYVLSVINADQNGTAAGFRLWGNSGRGAGPVIEEVPSPFSREVPFFGDRVRSGKRLSRSRRLLANRLQRERERHVQLLELERQRVRRLGAPGKRVAGRTFTLLAKPVPKVGDVETFRVWKSWGDCETFNNVQARAVYVGSRAIVFEDKNAPLAGKMDADLRALGAELDSVMYNILTANFGNPLAMDAKLDNDGHVRMLFTPQVAKLSSTTLAFVTSCDFYSAADADTASSNEGEVFYAKVPEKEDERAFWLRQNRPTVIHEVKHILSFAEHLSRETELEDSWLEEGMSMIAEELYVRTFSGSGWRANTNYRTGVWCDFHPDDPACPNRPYIMTAHYNALYDYYEAVEKKSPFKVDWDTVYGSAWALLRWTIDTTATDEGNFLRSITQSKDIGTANLAARAGRPLDELIAGWQLAVALDDYPGFSPAKSEFSFPSWNTRDVFKGLHDDPDTYRTYPKVFPLTEHEIKFGNFQPQTVPALPGGSGAFFELFGSQSATQLLEIQTTGGKSLPNNTTLRLAVARVQ
jgi:hypothetical protein